MPGQIQAALRRAKPAPAARRAGDPPDPGVPMPDLFDAFRLTGRTALVTGARREIGRAIALGLAGAGARLAIHHAGTAEEQADAASVVRDIESMGGEAAAFGQDFAEDDAGRHLAAAIT